MSVIGQLSLLLPYLHADSYTLYSGEKCKHFIAKTGRGRSISAKGEWHKGSRSPRMPLCHREDLHSQLLA